MIFVKCHYKDIPCVFSEGNHQNIGLERPMATWIVHHEFANYSPKPLCDLHKRRLEEFSNKSNKKKAK